MGGLGAAWAGPALPSETGVPLDPEPPRASPHALLGALYPVKSLGQRFRESWSTLSWAPCGSARGVDPVPTRENHGQMLQLREPMLPFRATLPGLLLGLCIGVLAALPRLSYPGAVCGCGNPPTQAGPGVVYRIPARSPDSRALCPRVPHAWSKISVS
ncbi:hypothetical protein I79_024095 [Cricetulus griseus]|uniref:Uncharacterized protein n=1 Tax=Cricetulus griseus TaxID=10029 RepID=G3IJQ9_CRIGR|nr:hypothetical protein I79_024095 [Cricetulus griseus]